VQTARPTYQNQHTSNSRDAYRTVLSRATKVRIYSSSNQRYKKSNYPGYETSSSNISQRGISNNSSSNNGGSENSSIERQTFSELYCGSPDPLASLVNKNQALHREKSLEKIHTFALKKGSATTSSAGSLAPPTTKLVVPKFLMMDKEPDVHLRTVKHQGHTNSTNLL
jgi:hypothetical protein